MNDNNNETKIKKVLYNQVSLAVAAVGLISSLIFWITSPQEKLEAQVSQIRSDVATNVQVADLIQDFKDNDMNKVQKKLDEIDARQIEIVKSLSRLEALHE